MLGLCRAGRPAIHRSLCHLPCLDIALQAAHLHKFPSGKTKARDQWPGALIDGVDVDTSLQKRGMLPLPLPVCRWFT
jgi:hypothetical protein